MVTLKRLNRPKQTYKAGYGAIPLDQVANQARPMPDEYIAEDGMDVTPAFLDYVRPLVGELPNYVSLAGKPAKP
jgi:6-phosphofructokinase 1